MPNWFRKTLVALITVFTFGLVTPPSILLDNAKAADKPTSTAGQQNLESTSYTYEETNDRLTTDTFYYVCNARSREAVDAKVWN